MLEIIVKSNATTEGYNISTNMKGEATYKEVKCMIKTMLKFFAESTDEEVVICALEEYAKERLGINE